jgi:hypothetical protein
VTLIKKLEQDREVEVNILVKTTQLLEELSSSSSDFSGSSSGSSVSENTVSGDALTALLPSSSTFYSGPASSNLLPIESLDSSSSSLPFLENQLRLRLSVRDSFCPGSESKTTTIVIVSLSVLSLVLLALLSLTLIILRRRKPYIFGNSSQVSPGLR